MKPATFRLALTAVLFLAWLAYLAYLVATRPVSAAGWPLVVSRPQVLTSRVDVIARVDSPGEPVTVEEVLWPEEDAPLKPGDTVRVEGIEACRPLPRREGEKPPPDFSGPGRYLLPLVPLGGQKGGYEVAPVPPSPGFQAPDLQRIYPATPEALAQYRQIKPAGE